MRWLEVTKTILLYVAFPFRLIWRALVWILYGVTLPFVHLGRIVSGILLIPLRILGHFEAVWYFLGSAIVVGLVFGGAAYVVVRVATLVFDLDRKPIPMSIPARGHDAASYRAARAEKKLRDKQKKERRAMRIELISSQPLIQEVVREARLRPVTVSSALSPNANAMTSRAGLFQDIILEQTDEEDHDSGF